MKQIRRAEMENEDWKTETITIQEMTMTQRTSRQKQRVAKADDFATEAKGGKARTEENSNKSKAATEMINEQGQ